MEQISFKVIGAVEHVPVPELTRLIELHYSHMVYHKQFDTVFDNASHERAEQYVVRSLMAGKKIMAMLLDGVIVGMIIYQRRKNVTLAGSTIYRFGITIAEECRGRNFANILTSELEKMENTGLNVQFTQIIPALSDT